MEQNDVNIEESNTETRVTCTWTEEDDFGWIEWIYIIHEHNAQMVIVVPKSHDEWNEETKKFDHVKPTQFAHIANVDLNGPEPDWHAIEKSAYPEEEA